MARSRYIYVIEQQSSVSQRTEVIACFTVKWECQSYIDGSGSDAQHWKVYRFPDGGAYWSKRPQPTDITAEMIG
jgi:hypothetical protein